MLSTWSPAAVAVAAETTLTAFVRPGVLLVLSMSNLFMRMTVHIPRKWAAPRLHFPADNTSFPVIVRE